MKKMLKIEYDGKCRTVGQKIVCDNCMRLIHDSRDRDSSNMYYLATIYHNDDDKKEIKYHLCGRECARRLFDGFLNYSKPTIRPGRFDIQTAIPFTMQDYNKVPNDISTEEYKRLQREAK